MCDPGMLLTMITRLRRYLEVTNLESVFRWTRVGQASDSDQSDKMKSWIISRYELKIGVLLAYLSMNMSQALHYLPEQQPLVVMVK